ncbi:hypothetical protein JF544_00540 [Halobacillus kuroshimensis]|uniref:Uncharacterized protein n=1 Tax=Halobacillus kuroshimensis TaxID=302481 RepID=A0ABS3DR31_9BACI|nr:MULTISPECIES: hypothetical protein [Halobacillus]MBN8233708.1 hypothetical protein [Halobacillus kuroshimensis]
MLVTVQPCFHWIGFHITSYLLQEGVEVIGVDPIETNQSDFLYMYVGRNSNFQHFFQKEDKENHVQGTEKEASVEYVDHHLLVRKNGETLWVKLPALYGEWMDLQRFGIQDKDQLKSWIKKKEAVYIGDFLNDLLKSLLHNQSFQLSSHVEDEELMEQRIEAVFHSQQLLC